MTSRAADGPGGRFPAAPPLLLVLSATVLLALNLRIPTTALGPLLPDLLVDTGHGETFLSLLTAIPLALTLVIAPLAPRMAARFGLDLVVGGALVGVVAGILVRSIPGDPTLLAGTALLGSAIAVGTVLAPASIAAEAPGRRGTLTGMYTMALSLGPALALGLTVPLMRATGLGWRGTLVLWSLCTGLALLLWVVRSRSASSGGTPVPSETPAVGGRSPRAIADPRAWVLAVYLGITSLTFYTTATWLPTVLVADGLTAGAAGGFTSLVNIVAIPFAFLAPIGMRRGLARVLAPLAPVMALAGLVLLITVGADAALGICLLLGIGQGLCLGVSYDQVVEYATSPEHAASVSALTSAVGVALAALGPLLFGFGLEATTSSVVPLIGLGVVIVAQAGLGIRSGRFRSAGPGSAPPRT